MSLRLNGSTSGYTELDAGAVAGNNTIKMPTANGSAYQVLRNGATAGTTEFADKIVSGTAVASTSGTSIDFTGIPAWVKRVTVMFNGVSTNGAGSSSFLVQIGSGSISSSGYISYAGVITNTNTTAVSSYTAGFAVTLAMGNSSIIYGHAILTLISSNIWVCSSVFGGLDAASSVITRHGGGTSPNLSGTLDRVRITTVGGTDTFDAGTINILYE